MNKKSLVIVAMLLSSMIAFVPIRQGNAAETPMLYLNPPNVTVDPVTNFNIDLTIANITGLRAWDVLIRFNPKIIRILTVTEGPFLSDEGSTEFLYSVFLGYELSATATLTNNPPAGPYGVNGTGILMSITFQCYDAGDPFNITIENSALIGWPAYLAGDINFDGVVLGGDLGILGANWGKTSTSFGFNRWADLNRDGVVLGGDLGILGANWGKTGGKLIVHNKAGTSVKNTFPVVKFSRLVLTDVSGQRATNQNPAPGDTVQFNATDSYAQTPATIASYTWNWGDGTPNNVTAAPLINHTFAAYSDYDGYTVTLTVTDNGAKAWSKSTQIRIWRDLVAIDIWPCYDDYLGLVSVLPGENMAAGTIMFPTGAYLNSGTLKQNVTIVTFLMNSATKANTTVVSQFIKNKGPDVKSNLWGVPYYTWTGIEINDPNLTATLATNAKLMFVDYDESGFYDVGYYERPIWDTDSSGNVTAGDIDVTAGAVIAFDDVDIDATLTFDGNVTWVDNNANGAFDIGERAYYDSDASGTVSDGDFYIWLESFYYGVVYDVLIVVVPTGSYQFVITVASTQTELDLTNNEFVYSPIFNVL
jgi:hypothetical protein